MAIQTVDEPRALSIKERVVEAILKRIEGSKDLKKRLDYLMNPETLSSSARLTEIQVQAVAECQWLGQNFPSLKPLAEFSKGFASWTISKDGKGREETVAVMVSETREIISTLGLPISPLSPEKKEEKRGKREKNE